MRQLAVESLHDTCAAAQPDLQALVHSVALACGMPISLVSLVGQDEQWFAAEIGLNGMKGTPRSVSFCAHTIQQSGILEVQDTSADPRFAENSLVTGWPNIRFYAGAPLVVGDGLCAGALCVIDNKPGQLSDGQREILTNLAKVAVQLLVRRREQDESERVAAELQALNDTVPLGIYAADDSGRCRHTNAQWRVIFDLSEDDALGRSWLRRIHPADRDKVFAQWKASIQSRTEFGMQFRLLLPDTTVKHIRAVSRPTFGQGARIIGHVGSVEDITKDYLTQKKLDQKRDRLSAIIEATGAATFEWNLQTSVGRVGESWAQIAGYKLSEIGPIEFTRDFREIHPDDQAGAVATLENSLACDINQPFEIKYRKLHANGHWIWVLTRFRVTSTTADGQPEWISAVQIDITEEKRQELALKHSQSLVDQTGELAGVGGWSIDLLTGELTWTDQTCRIHGIEPPYQPKLNNALDFYAPTSRPVIEEAVKVAMEFGTPWDLELELIRVDGQKIWVRAVGAVDFEGNIPVRVYGAFQDVSARYAQEQAILAEKTRVLLATRSGGIGIWDLDVRTGQGNWDEQIYRLFGIDPTSTEDRQALWRRAVHPDDIAQVETTIAHAMQYNLRVDNSFRVIWPDGSLHYLRSVADPVVGKPGVIIGVNWDVTDIRNLTDALAGQHELMRVTMRSIGDGVITTDANGHITWMNPVAEQMTGWTSAEANGKPMDDVFKVLDEVTLMPAQSPVETCLIGGTSVGLATGSLLVSRTGTQFGIEDSAAPIKDDNGKVLGVVLVFHDVTAERHARSEMTYRATHDALTGVKNRTEFELRLTRLLKQSAADNSSHAMMFIDLDQFKLVNDACGHSAGDEVLQQAARIFSDTIRSRDLIARIGGDEFGIILEHCTIEAAERIAQSICDKMDEYRYAHGDRRFRIGASIGLVPVDSRWSDTAALIQTADASCAIAKDSGRNRVQIWQDSAAALMVRQGEVHWASRLETALEEDRFVLFAQPISALTPAAPGVHAELLIRLVDTDGALILPGVFMPSAERFNLATPIDRWVLKQAISFLSDLNNLTAISTISINLSGRSIGDRAFHRYALELLNAAGPEICARLSLEITETAAVANVADAALFIEQVHSLKVRVALDDFGAGAASFGYLRTLRVDSLKIDGQFIKGLQTDPISNVTVKCFIELARIMGIPTVAEFVDHPDLLSAVKALGIDFAQGYLISQPQPLSHYSWAAPGLSGKQVVQMPSKPVRGPVFSTVDHSLSLGGLS